MKRLSFFSAFLAVFFIFISFFTFPSSFIATSAENHRFIENGDFESYEGMLLNTPTDWALSNFEYDTAQQHIYSNQNGATATQENKVLPVGIYEYSAKAYTISGSAEISLQVIGNTETVEKTFTVNTDNKTFSFYLFRKNRQTVSFQVQIKSTSGTVYVDDVSVKSADAVLTTEEGASIRNAQGNSGLRFKGRIDKDFYDECILTLGKNNVDLGVMIVPKRNLSDKTTFTVADLGEDTPLFISANKFNNADTASIDGYYGFNCAITNVSPENTDCEFAARAYLRYTIDGVSNYLYAEYDEAKHCRSVYGVAQAAKAKIDSGEITDVSTIAVVNEYLDKIQTIVYYAPESGESNRIIEDGQNYYISFNTTNRCIMQLSFDKQYNNGITVTGSEKQNNGYYLLSANSTVTVTLVGTLVFGTLYTCPVDYISVKLYKAD